MINKLFELTSNHCKCVDLTESNRPYILGRHKSCDLRADVNMLQISNRHCIIELKQCSANDKTMQPYLRDLSMNGTLINGRRIESGGNGRSSHVAAEVPLKHNDHIELIGGVAFVVFRDPELERQQKLQETEFASFQDYFVLDGVIGRGSFGVVRCGIRKATGQRVACKIIFKDKVKSQPGKEKLLFHHIKQEIEILRQIQHPNLIRTWDIFERKGCIAIMMELLEAGDLFALIERRGRIPEQEARFMTFQLLLGLEYLHSRNMCHRDLKPENILIGSAHPYARLVIADFGLAKAGLDETVLKTFCGTMGYLAPEVISRGGGGQGGAWEGYTVAVDCWSLGVIVYSMLAGYFPFPDESDVALTQAVNTATFDFRSQEWLAISREAMDFISCLIVVDPAKRMTVAQAFQHPWIAEFINDLQVMYNVYIMDHYKKNSLDRTVDNSCSDGQDPDVTISAEGAPQQ